MPEYRAIASADEQLIVSAKTGYTLALFMVFSLCRIVVSMMYYGGVFFDAIES